MQAHEQAKEDTERAETQIKKAEEEGDDLSKTLDKLAAAYASLPFSLRPAFLTRIHYHVTRRAYSARKELDL